MPTDPEYTAEQLVAGSTIAARLYVLAALEEAEVLAQHAMVLAFGAARRKYADDLKGQRTWQLLVAAVDMEKGMDSNDT